MGAVEELLERVQAWARTETNVRAAFVVGSQARSETPADEWSDVDVVLLADDPARLIEEADWLGEFGTPQLSFVEETAIGKERERRVLYEAGVDVDFAIFPVAALPALLSAPDAARAIARGYLIVHDEIDLEQAFAGRTTEPVGYREPREIVHDFWYHALWAAKKLRRGEAITARRCLDSALNGCLIELARAHALARRPGAEVWHSDRFVERWADPRALDACWITASSPEELPGALYRICDAFGALAGELLPADAGVVAARRQLADTLG